MRLTNSNTSGSSSSVRDPFLRSENALPYPLQGIIFLLIHPTLLRFAFCFIILSLLLSLLFTIFLFTVVFPWQIHVFIHSFQVDPTSATFLAFLCTLVEMVLVSFVTFAVFPNFYLDQLFAHVLHLHGLRTNSLSTWIRSCSRYARVAIGVRLALGLGTLPLHCIPILGSISWAWINGILLLWEYHQFWLV